jgi:hypothetical protein
MVCGMVSSLCPVTDDEDGVVDGDSTGHTKKPPSALEVATMKSLAL